MDILDTHSGNLGNVNDVEIKAILEKYGTINYEEDGTTIKGIMTKEKGYEILLSDIWKETLNKGEVVNPPTIEGYIKPEGTIQITQKAKNNDVKKYEYADTTQLYTEAEMIKKSRELIILNKNRSEYEVPEGVKLAYIIVTRATTNIAYTITITGNVITSNQQVSSTSRWRRECGSYY